MDGVVLVGEHGVYHSNLKGQKYYPRWWLYQQIIRVFEQSKRSVPVFNDKHLSTSWDEAKWMFDKSRELDFPLYGGSSIPFYYRKPEIELDIDTPIKASIVAGGAGDEGSLFHCVDVLQSFVERRKGGETGIEAVQCIQGPETWKWTDRNPWAGKLLDAVRTSFDLKPGHFQATVREPCVSIVDYRDGTKAAVYSVRGVGWTYAGDIEGRKDPTIISMLGCNGPRSLPVIEPDSAPGIVALVSPFSIISKRSSPSRVRFAAPFGAPLTAPGRFGGSSSKGKTARFGQGANVTLAEVKIAVRYNVTTSWSRNAGRPARRTRQSRLCPKLHSDARKRDDPKTSPVRLLQSTATLAFHLIHACPTT